MSSIDFKDLSRHIGHDIACVTYGKSKSEPVNVAVECETCSEVLLNYDNPKYA